MRRSLNPQRTVSLLMVGGGPEVRAMCSVVVESEELELEGE
jgi:hypothetical protein